MQFIKMFWRFAKRYKMVALLISTALIKVVGDVADAASIKVFQILMDTLQIGSSGSNKLWSIFVLLIGSLAAVSICYFVKMVLRANGRERAIKDARMDFVSHIAKTESSSLVELDDGMITTVDESIDGIVDSVHFIFSEEIMQLTLSLVINIVVMFTTNVKLSLISLVSVLPVGIVLVLHSKRFGPATDARINSRKVLRAQVARLNLFATIKIYAKELFERERTSKLSDDYKKAGIERKAVNRDFMSIIILSCNIMQIAIALYAIYMVPKGEITVPALMVFYTLQDRIIQPFYKMVDVIDDISSLYAQFKKYYQLMDLPEEIDGDIEMTSFNDTIKLSHVSFSYENDTNVLNNINMTIRKGEKIGIYGESGGGKSSLVNLINRMYRVDNGSIYIDGININEFTAKSLRRNIGIVSQRVELFGDATVRENIAYGMNSVTDAEIVEAAKKANAHEFITKLKDGYDSKIGRNGIKLSDGQAQRISLARIFLLNPPILILDEATSKLDNESERIVQDAIDKLQGDKTVIAIAHRLTTIKKFDRLYGISNHTISEVGSHKELIKKKDSIWYKYNKSTE